MTNPSALHTACSFQTLRSGCLDSRPTAVATSSVLRVKYTVAAAMAGVSCPLSPEVNETR